MRCMQCKPIDMQKFTHAQHDVFEDTHKITSGSDVTVTPYKCKDINVEVSGADLKISGFYGYDFNDHDHDIKLMMLDGSIETFTEFSSIPLDDIREVISFHPNYLHDKEFFYTCSDGTIIRHNVHNTMSMWGMKMLELLEICKNNRGK